MQNRVIIKTESLWLVNFDLWPVFAISPNMSDFDNLFFVVNVVDIFLQRSEINAFDYFHARDPPRLNEKPQLPVGGLR